MNRPSSIIQAFDRALPHLRTSVGDEEVLLTRLTRDCAAEVVTLAAAPEDAFAVIFQLRSLPAHDLLFDGRAIEIPGGPSQSLGLVDLAGDAGARVDSAIDSIHVRVPRAALDTFADRTGQKSVQRLHQPDGPFSSVDPMIGQLSGVLVETMRSTKSGVFVDQLLLTLLAHLTDRYGEGQAAADRSAGQLSPWQERRAKALLDVAKPPSLAEIAAACGISLAHFSRAFRASVGEAPWAWHQTRQIEQAKSLMRDPDVTLAHVAAAAGFSDQSHFSRTFAAREGVAPSRWRRDKGFA